MRITLVAAWLLIVGIGAALFRGAPQRGPKTVPGPVEMREEPTVLAATLAQAPAGSARRAAESSAGAVAPQASSSSIARVPSPNAG